MKKYIKVRVIESRLQRPELSNPTQVPHADGMRSKFSRRNSDFEKTARYSAYIGVPSDSIDHYPSHKSIWKAYDRRRSAQVGILLDSDC